MSALVSVWIVRNPGPHSTLADIVWCQPVVTLDNYIRGLPSVVAWPAESHTVYVSEEEAMRDARRRIEWRRERGLPVGA